MEHGKSMEHLLEHMKQAGSMKHAGMMQVELTNIKAESYGEGYSDGWSDGYDQAIKNTTELAMKCAVGGSKAPAEKELRPAVRFMHRGKSQQLNKVVEECDEVIQAWNDGEGDERVAEELVDVQMACETMLAMLGYTEEQRKKIRLDVINKNSRRGYYMPPKEKYGN